MVHGTWLSPEGSEGLEVDGLQDVLRGVELQQQHDEDAVVRQLLEFCLSHIMILDQNAYYNAEHLQTTHAPGQIRMLLEAFFSHLCRIYNISTHLHVTFVCNMNLAKEFLLQFYVCLSQCFFSLHTPHKTAEESFPSGPSPC